MATTFKTALAAQYLSAAIPDIDIQTDSDKVTLSVRCLDTGAILFTETYHAVDGIATVTDVRSIIEQYMQEQMDSFMNFRLQVRDQQSNGEVKNMQVLYYIRTPQCTFANFATQRFMTPWSVKHVALNSTHDLHVLVKAGEDTVLRLTCCYRREEDGEVLIYRQRIQVASAPDNLYYERSVSISPKEIAKSIATAISEQEIELLSVTAEMGLRSVTYYIDPIPSTLTLRFRNSLNALECLSFHALIKARTEVSAEDAICGEFYSQYDRQVNQTWEINIDNLPPLSAQMLDELLASPYIEVTQADLTHAYGRITPFVHANITESTLEPSFNSGELASAEFTLRLESDRQPGRLGTIQRIHNRAFSNQFN